MAKVTILLADEAREVECQAGDNLLDVILKSGIDMEFSCKTGECGVCQVKIVEGEENLSEPDIDEEDTLFDKIDDGIRLACKTQVLGDVKVKVKAH